MNHTDRAYKIVVDYENLKDMGPPGDNQALLRDLIAVALREVEQEALKREAGRRGEQENPYPNP